MYLKGIGKCPKKPKQEFRDDGFFITGDIGTMDERQLPYPSWAALRTSLYLGGYNVYPKEIEIILDDVEGVYESASHRRAPS